MTALTFTVTYHSEKQPSERRLFSLHSHLILDLLAGKLQERGTGTGVGNSLDLGQTKCAKKTKLVLKTFNTRLNRSVVL